MKKYNCKIAHIKELVIDTSSLGFLWSISSRNSSCLCTIKQKSKRYCTPVSEYIYEKAWYDKQCKALQEFWTSMTSWHDVDQWYRIIFWHKIATTCLWWYVTLNRLIHLDYLTCTGCIQFEWLTPRWYDVMDKLNAIILKSSCSELPKYVAIAFIANWIT